MPGNPTQRPLRRIVTIVVAVLVIPVVVHAAQIAWVFLAPPVEYYLHASKFDSAGWKAREMDAEVMWPTRLRMVDDLLERRALNGLARARVEELLGPADDTAYFRDWISSNIRPRTWTIPRSATEVEALWRMAWPIYP